MKKAKNSRSQIETKRSRTQKALDTARTRNLLKRKPKEAALAVVDASPKEARDLSAQAQEGAKTIETAWWKLARLVDICLKRHVPRALGLTAKQWLEKYLEGSVSDAFRKRRTLLQLEGVPEEKLHAMKQANAQQLCRLPVPTPFRRCVYSYQRRFAIRAAHLSNAPVPRKLAVSIETKAQHVTS